MSLKAKIIVGGPPESGKTYIANVLADATESLGGQYETTHGVRILEFDVDGQINGGVDTVRVGVELWDCGGGQQFEDCWPAFGKDAKGVVLVYRQEESTSQIKILEKWYKYFIKQHGLKDGQCLLLAVHKPNSPPVKGWEVPSALLQSVQCVHVNMDGNPNAVKEIFTSFLMELVGVIREKQEKEEQGIVGKRK